jgi:hypothetical protein
LATTEAVNRVHDNLKHCVRELGKDWQSESFICSLFTLRKIALMMAQVSEAFLKMKRQRIIDLSPNLFSFQVVQQLVTSAIPNDKLVVDVPPVSSLVRQHDVRAIRVRRDHQIRFFEKLFVSGCIVLSSAGPIVEVL